MTLKPRFLIRVCWTGLVLIAGLGLAATGSATVARPDAEDANIGVNQQAALGDPLGQPLAGEQLEQQTELVASKLRCPVCQGLSVADSRTVSALAMKGEVEDFLAQGYSQEQVLEYFERSYGEFIRLEPKAEGFNLVVWILSGLMVLVGGLLIARRLRKGAQLVDVSEDAELAAYRARVRQELES